MTTSKLSLLDTLGTGGRLTLVGFDAINLRLLNTASYVRSLVEAIPR